MNSNWTDLICHPVAVPERAGLRRFAFVIAGATAILFGGLFPWLLDTGIAIWPFCLAAALVLWGVARPESLRQPYIFWIRIGLLINRFTAPMILLIVFYGIITPIGVLRRLRRDPLDRQFDRRADSYRKPLRKTTRENLEKPF